MTWRVHVVSRYMQTVIDPVLATRAPHESVQLTDCTLGYDVAMGVAVVSLLRLHGSQTVVELFHAAVHNLSCVGPALRVVVVHLPIMGDPEPPPPALSHRCEALMCEALEVLLALHVAIVCSADRMPAGIVCSIWSAADYRITTPSINQLAAHWCK